MNCFGFITVRTGSSRLPQKCLLSIRGKRVIEHIIDRAKLINGLAGVVVCTSVEPEDDVLEKVAKEKGALFFRGSLKDKLQRYSDAVSSFDADYVILLDGDDLFCDPELNEMAIKQMVAEPCDFMKPPDGLVSGAFDFCLSAAAIKRACEIKDTDNTEMYEVYFLESGRFRVCDLEINDPIFFNDQVRLTLDYQEDLDFFRRIFDELGTDVNNVPLRKIMKLLNEKPEIAQINLFRHQDYLAKRELMRATKKIKKI